MIAKKKKKRKKEKQQDSTPSIYTKIQTMLSLFSSTAITSLSPLFFFIVFVCIWYSLPKHGCVPREIESPPLFYIDLSCGNTR